uniref:Uncharacterized protein n=1 Tax=Physcomitrium patens TaxID=3218 RepID=A0A2K1JYY3_PHYPA|nr:hypothetical protein PHYPA_013854 [Physcomitrium patens]
MQCSSIQFMSGKYGKRIYEHPSMETHSHRQPQPTFRASNFPEESRTHQACSADSPDIRRRPPPPLSEVSFLERLRAVNLPQTNTKIRSYQALHSHCKFLFSMYKNNMC